MATATIKGFIQARKSGATGTVSFTFMTLQDMTHYDYVCVMPHEIVVEIPEGFTVEGSQAGALESARKRKLAEVAAIDAQIAGLATKSA